MSLSTAMVDALSSAPQDELAEQVLDAAREQFLEFGIRRTTVEDVARRAGVGRMTVYRRFGSRDGLLQALGAREAKAAIRQVEDAVANAAPDDRIAVAFVATVRYAAQHELLQRVIVTDPETVLPLLTTNADGLLQLAVPVIAEHVKAAQQHAKAKHAVAPELVAELLARAVLSLLLTPNTALPVDDDVALRDIADRTFVPLVLGGARA